MTTDLETRLRGVAEALERAADDYVATGPAQGGDRVPRRMAVLVAAVLVVVALAGVGALARRPSVAPLGQLAVLPVDVTAAPPTTAPVSTTDATATTAVVPPGLVAFGESVMKGATNELAAGGFTLDALENRQARDLLEAVTTAAAAGQLGPTVVIQVGTNGTVSDADLDAIVAAVPASSTVYFLTVKANVPWIADNNERIRALPVRHPNVRIIDWEQRAQEITDQLSTSDGGAHLKTRAAMQFYANMIFDAIGRPDLDRPLDVGMPTTS